MSGLVLSLFPGIGLLDRGFEDEGFAVVRGPDMIFGGDVHKFRAPAGRFNGVIGGPPCQQFSSLAHICRARGFKLAANLIPEYERIVAEAQPDWFIMENVRGAPLPNVPGYQVHALLLNNRQFGGVQNRVRRISFGTRDGRPLLPRIVALEPSRWAPAVLANSGGRRNPVKVGGSGKVKKTWSGGDLAKRRSSAGFKEACELQGLPEGFDVPAFTLEAKLKAVGNGVPYWLARGIAAAVRESFCPEKVPTTTTEEAR